MNNENITVAVGMSGGVDSSTVAYLLRNQGYKVIGITMKHWGGMNEKASENSKNCCSLDDVYDAKRVCDDLGIPHYTINFEEDFKDIVVDYFVSEYEKGRTPNPCMVCNRNIKLGKLVDFASKIGADYFATGHYAEIVDGDLYMGKNIKKDQTYFLSQIKKEYFRKIMFPLGQMSKEEVRELAKELGVRVYAKRDSQEICFIEDDDYKRFLVEMTNGKIKKSGNIVDEKGNILGKHEASAFYTIGQRKGLGITSPKPLYVLRIDTAKNEVIVGDNEQLFSDKLVAENINMLGFDNVQELDGVSCLVKTRSRDKLHKATLKVVGESIEVLFDEKVRAITPGQGAVFYQEDGKVLSSGYIK